jgi:RNA-directed DNA polymerase
MKVRTRLTRRKRRHKRRVGWRRWSNAYLYGVLGLFWDCKLRPLQGAGAYQ